MQDTELTYQSNAAQSTCLVGDAKTNDIDRWNLKTK